MPALNWGLIQDGGIFESLMHAILYAEDPNTILFGRPGKDAGQDARTSDGILVYQSKYRDGLDMDGAIKLAVGELEVIKKYRAANHANYEHWKDVKHWVLFANFSINPNDDAKWISKVIPEFKKEGLTAEYCGIEIIEGKLAQHPEVCDVFFGQENRVLVGIKEAHDLLRNERIGGVSLDSPMIGRDAERKHVKDFTSSLEKRVLPVIGPGGIGKSRFLYESLVTLSQEGWRVLWGLSGAMIKSSQWFRLLNGNQKTCVALDDPDDPDLFRAVIEQLATVERRNWCVIVSYRSSKSETLRRYKSNSFVETPIQLERLNESASKLLLNTNLGFPADDAWLHSIYQFTRGNPGWLCLIVDLAKQGRLSELPPKADDIASLYVGSCLERFQGPTANNALVLLRWLALWGTLLFDSRSEESDDIAFLEREGVPKAALRDLFKSLVGTGLVRNWGVGKRCYGVESLLIRQHILSQWLLDDGEDGKYSVNSAGADLVRRLLSDRLPRLDATLQTISHLSLSRLELQEAHTLLRPISEAMASSAKDVSLFTQNHLVELVARLGPADPESALDVLIAIRENMKADEEVENSFWGKRTFTQSKLLTTLSWTLFNLTETVNDADVAYRFLLEYRELLKVVESGLEACESGKTPQQLLQRLLCESRQSSVFAKPAYDLAVEHVLFKEWWPFVAVLAKCILEPAREIMHWVANSTLAFARFAISPGTPGWENLLNLRAKLFEILQQDHPEEVYIRIWPLLAESHRSVHAATSHIRMSPDAIHKYQEVMVNDLNLCVSILERHRSFTVATRARPMWKWHLKYGKEEKLVVPARECERIYSGLSKWRIHDFFRFDYDKELKAETDRVVAILRNNPDPAIYHDFFGEAERYLKAVRQGKEDMADGGRFG